MNLLLLEEVDRSPSGGREAFRITGDRARHLREVLRVEPGRRLKVGLVEGPRGEAEVVVMDGEWIELRCRFDPAAPPRPLVDLVLALPRPQSLKKLLPEVAAFGVDRLVLVNTWRVAKSFFGATLLRPENYRPYLRDGMMQGGVTHEPRVTLERRFRPYVQDRLPESLEGGARGIIAHPDAERPLAGERIGRDERVVLVIGPEGGLIPSEIELLEGQGFVTVSMGPRTLRVETACVALLAQVELLRQQDRDT